MFCFAALNLNYELSLPLDIKNYNIAHLEDAEQSEAHFALSELLVFALPDHGDSRSQEDRDGSDELVVISIPPVTVRRNDMSRHADNDTQYT